MSPSASHSASSPRTGGIKVSLGVLRNFDTCDLRDAISLPTTFGNGICDICEIILYFAIAHPSLQGRSTTTTRPSRLDGRDRHGQVLPLLNLLLRVARQQYHLRRPMIRRVVEADLDGRNLDGHVLPLLALLLRRDRPLLRFRSHMRRQIANPSPNLPHLDNQVLPTLARLLHIARKQLHRRLHPVFLRLDLTEPRFQLYQLVVHDPEALVNLSATALPLQYPLAASCGAL